MTLDAFILRLKREAAIEADEPPFTDDGDAYLRELSAEAAREHNNSYTTIPAVPEREVPLVVLLAWMRVLDVRLGRSASENNLSGASGYGQDRNTPFYKTKELRRSLEERYRMLADRLGISAQSLPGVSVSSLVVEDDLHGGTVPLTASNVPVIELIETTRDQGAGTITLKWTMRDYSNWKATHIAYLQHETTSVRQEWNYDSASGYPQVDNAAVVMGTPKPGFKERSAKIEGVVWGAPGTKHRFMIVVEGQGGQWGYSNELIAVAT